MCWGCLERRLLLKITLSYSWSMHFRCSFTISTLSAKPSCATVNLCSRWRSSSRGNWGEERSIKSLTLLFWSWILWRALKSRHNTRCMMNKKIKRMKRYSLSMPNNWWLKKDIFKKKKTRQLALTLQPLIKNLSCCNRLSSWRSQTRKERVLWSKLLSITCW